MAFQSILPKSRILTLDALKQANACTRHIELFEEIFGDEVVISSESLRKADAAGLDISWFGQHFSKDPEAFDKAMHPITVDFFKPEGRYETYLTRQMALILESI
jgi:hypothetical protein